MQVVSDVRAFHDLRHVEAHRGVLRVHGIQEDAERNPGGRARILETGSEQPLLEDVVEIGVQDALPGIRPRQSRPPQDVAFAGRNQVGSEDRELGVRGLRECPASAPMRQIEGAAFRRVLVSS